MPDGYRLDEILGKYGKEMTWDIKAGCMGKRAFPETDPLFAYT